MTGAEGCEEESLGARRETGLGADFSQLNPRPLGEGGREAHVRACLRSPACLRMCTLR